MVAGSLSEDSSICAGLLTSLSEVPLDEGEAFASLVRKCSNRLVRVG